MPWWESNPKLAEVAKFSVIEELTITHRELGRGSYGTVYAALHSGKPCVAKQMHPFLQHDKLEIFVREINILSTLKHPSIVQFLGVYFKDKTPMLVMEMMWKSLYSLLEEQPNQLFLLTKAHILYDVACGLQYLHSQKKPVVYRDLYPSNILLNENFDAKIADLGQAKPLNDELAKKFSTTPGNIFYMAPETLQHKPTYDTKLDVFSIGCTIIHLVTEKVPMPTDQLVESQSLKGNFQKASEADRRIEFLSLMKDTPMLRHIAYQCLEDAPANRPTASYICDELKKYIYQLESEAPKLAKQHNKDKFALLKLLQSQENQLERKAKLIEGINKDKSALNDSIAKKDEYISSLESQCEGNEKELKENELTILATKQNTETLQQKLTDLDKMNEDLTITYKNLEDLLRKDLKTKQEEIKAASEEKNQKQKEIDDLQDKLKEKKSNFLQLISDLENDKQKIKADAENCKQERDQLFKANSDYAERIKHLEQQVDQLQSKLEGKDKHIEVITTEKDSIIADLNEKLKTQEYQVTQNVATYEEYKSKYASLEREHKKLQENFKKQLAEGSQLNPVCNKVFDTPGSQLQQKLLKLQSMNEKELQQLQRDRQKLIDTIKQQHAKVAAVQAQLLDSRKKSAALSQQLEEKSYCLNTLGSSLHELQESFSYKMQKLKLSEEEIAALKKQLDNNDKIQQNFKEDLKSKKESLKRKEEELELQKKEHADEMNNLHDRYRREINDLHEDIERYKAQIDSQGEISSLLKKEAEYKSDLEKSTKDRFQKLDNERKSLSRSEKELKRLIKYRDADIKEKSKKIKSLEKGFLNGHSHGYNCDVHWYPYLSLSTKLIRPSVAIITDKVFVTGGYQSTSPQDKELEDYLQTLDDKSNVVCFNLAKCQCDTINSPVQLGALASVNGQCVLVSGADSVGNTLTGNVYVLCEEGSRDQWKEFSKPLPTPRILACAYCYVNRWLIVCGGFTSKSKEEFCLLEAVSIVEILDTTKGEWYTLSEENCPNFSTILCCAVVREDVYVVGSDQVIKTSCNKLLKAATSNNTLVWDNVQIETEESNKKLYPFSVVEVNGEPMIIASMTDGEDDVTCVLMKDTRGRWRIMSKAVECQHCSAAVMTSSLELLLFGGSEKISVIEPTDISQKATLILTLNMWGDVSCDSVPITASQLPNLSFTGPIHTIQFDHNEGTFQSPIHKVSLVVPPNALSDGEKVTVYMGATTSGPFDLPEDCKLRSAVVWLSVSPSNVVFKRSISVIVPHSTVFTSSQHHSMMRFVICEDSKGPRYKFRDSLNQYEVNKQQGLIELSEFGMIAIVSGSEFAYNYSGAQVVEGFDSNESFQAVPEDNSIDASNVVTTNDTNHHQQSSCIQKRLKTPPACYLAKLFWPRGKLPSSFKADVYYIQKIPTLLYMVDTVYKKHYYEENGAYPEVVDTEFVLHTDKVKCVLPCYGSSDCDCLTGWDVTQMTDMNEIQFDTDSSQPTVDPLNFSVKFNCSISGASLTCFFEFQGAKRLIEGGTVDLIPTCLQQKYYSTDNVSPFILQKGVHCNDTTVTTKEPNGGMIHEGYHNENDEITEDCD